MTRSVIGAYPAWLGRHWFLIGLAIALTTSVTGSTAFSPLLEWVGLRHTLVFTVMFLAGWTLPLAMVQRAVARPAASLWAIGLNTLAVPCVALAVGACLAPQWLAGLMIAAWMPCTLASAAVWTRRAGGDDAIALITTVVTNLTCVVITPIGLAATLWLVTDGRPLGTISSFQIATAPTIDAVSQILKLATLVLAPLVLSQLARRGAMGAWADQHKPWIGTLAQLGILVMVFFGGIACGQRWSIPSDDGAPTGIPGFLDAASLLAAVAIVHGVVLWLGVAVAAKSGMPRSSQIAVGFSGSQKTLMIGLQIALDAGVTVLPMIAYHLIQLLVDTVVADRWRQLPDSHASVHE